MDRAACPVDNVFFDSRTLSFIDSDGDRRIRAMELISAVKWTISILKDLILSVIRRNGIFYDRSGKDWDAGIVKIIENSISLKQAFWLPTKVS